MNSFSINKNALVYTNETQPLLSPQRDSNSNSSESSISLAEEGSTAPVHRLRPRIPAIFENCLYFTDVILSVFVFSPLVCMYWFCTWEFLDEYFFKDDPLLSNYLSFAFGVFIIFNGYMTQNQMQKCYVWAKAFKYGLVLRFLIRNSYAYLITLAIIFQWRAIWNLFVIYITDDLHAQLAIAAGSLAYFCLTRSTRTLTSNPFILFKDDTDDFFVSVSRHKINWINFCFVQYFIDFTMIELIECLFNNFIWFGVQNYMDSVIYPDDKLTSLFVTFTSSYLASLLLLSIQKVLFNKCAQFPLIARVVVEDLFNILMFITAILYWKFYWDLFSYLISSDPTIAFYFFLLGHFVSFTIFIIVNATGSLVGPGVDYLDGEIEETRAYCDINFTNDLFKSFFEQQNEDVSENESILINPNV